MGDSDDSKGRCNPLLSRSYGHENAVAFVWQRESGRAETTARVGSTPCRRVRVDAERCEEQKRGEGSCKPVAVELVWSREGMRGGQDGEGGCNPSPSHS
jgi:hypothetical protein